MTSSNAGSAYVPDDADDSAAMTGGMHIEVDDPIDDDGGVVNSHIVAMLNMGMVAMST